MKRSQIALLSVGGVLALAVIASVVSARIAPDRGAAEVVDAQASNGGAGPRGFREVEVAGRWHVRLSRGDDWRVDLSYPEVLEDRWPSLPRSSTIRRSSAATAVRRLELPDMNADIIADIVTFWLSDSRDSPDRASARRDWWYRGGAVVDEEIRVRFGDLVSRALAGEPMGWRETPDGALALVLLLDQFTRNLYRGTVDAYAGDALAFEIVNHAIDRELDRALHPVARIWLCHPFHHSEDVAEQDRGLGLLRALRRDADPAWHGYVERSIKGWTRHRDIVARFGRFPHRNAVLGRESTTEEQAYMAAGGESFGQRLRADNATC